MEFKPLNNTNTADKCRPENIDCLKNYEYDCIHTLNSFYVAECCGKKKYIECDLNKQSKSTVIGRIIRALDL